MVFPVPEEEDELFVTVSSVHPIRNKYKKKAKNLGLVIMVEIISINAN